ncbi:hypothetical protein CPB84DRAFT_1018985 [Gymnopilus junonius]|uniref:Uncharacterized protein n=1 Tax=Gymnopilus junonius TaxID=109634 RepID=A0A9P5NMW8_GYMJU|nr:hypothetical protein CPB84DRAFT_1018985 [Gymnopilus junonius]
MPTEIQFTQKVASATGELASDSLNDQVFPLELLQHIIDDVDITSSEGKTFLVTLPYTSRDFAIISQKRLFSNIDVQLKISKQDNFAGFFEDEETNGPKFLSLLDGSPHIASYVRNLTVTLIDFPNPKHRGPSFRQMSSLQSILPRFRVYACLELPVDGRGDGNLWKFLRKF